jgi:hypothetical protein
MWVLRTAVSARTRTSLSLGTVKTRHQFVTKTRLFSVSFAGAECGKARKLKGFRVGTTKLTR